MALYPSDMKNTEVKFWPQLAGSNPAHTGDSASRAARVCHMGQLQCTMASRATTYPLCYMQSCLWGEDIAASASRLPCDQVQELLEQVRGSWEIGKAAGCTDTSVYSLERLSMRSLLLFGPPYP